VNVVGNVRTEKWGMFIRDHGRRRSGQRGLRGVALESYDREQS
jgi:hypothetical protein